MSEIAVQLDRLLEKHARRALLCLAQHVCATDKTTGFCGPELDETTGKIICRHGGDRVSCAPTAHSLLHSIGTRGVIAFWPFDKELPEQVAKADLVAAYERRSERRK